MNDPDCEEEQSWWNDPFTRRWVGVMVSIILFLLAAVIISYVARGM